MKKFAVLFSTILVVFAALEVKAQVPEIGVAIGASYPKAPDKVGFDSAVKFNYKVNRIFLVGVESGFSWINSEKRESEFFNESNLDLAVVSSVNFYSVPVLGMITLNFPFGDYSPMSFFVSGGAGYSWTFYRGHESYTFAGFTWQALAGLAYAYSEDYGSMKLFCEIGYKGTSVKSDMENTGGQKVRVGLDMSAPFVRVGVAFPLGSSDYMY